MLCLSIVATNRSVSNPAKPTSLQPLRRCNYCGHPLDGGRKRTCSRHKDLPDRDPHWKGFIGDECGCTDCINRWAESNPDAIEAIRALL